MSKKALVIGATGLIGRNLVFELLKCTRYTKVTVLARRELVIKHDKLNEVLLDFDELESFEAEMDADDIFCCLGSTTAKTPDPIMYRKIDFDYPLLVAKIARNKGASQFLLVSSLGANIDSTIFYSRLKGEVEEAIATLNYPSFQIFRPSILLGSRNESRPLETISQYMMGALGPFFIGPLRLYRAVKGSQVARAMLLVARNGEKGKHIIQNNRILDIVEADKETLAGSVN